MKYLDEPTTSRVRPDAARWELAAVVLVVLAGWWALLGWDWAVTQTTFDWIAFGLIAMLGVGWLALRGRGAAGTLAVTVPVILLSGWRLAVSGVTGWPVGLGSLVFSLSLTCMVTAGLGAWVRRVGARRDVGARP
jgi:hypothetical protein